MVISFTKTPSQLITYSLGKSMKPFQEHLQEKLKDLSFKHDFSKYWHLASLAVQVDQHREAMGLGQVDLAIKSSLDIEQIKQIDDADNDRISVGTIFKVLDALGLEIVLKAKEKK